MMSLFHHSFLPTTGPQPPSKLENYAHLYATYTNLIQQQENAMRHDLQAMEYAYNQVAAEFATEQHDFAQNKSGTSYILADLNEYARRCNSTAQSFEE